MYEVYKRVSGCRVFVTVCSDIEEASRAIRADALMSGVGCVYEIELKKEAVPA